MKSIEEIAQSILENKTNQNTQSNNDSKRVNELHAVLEFFANALNDIHEELKNKKIEVTNQPTEMKINGEVSVKQISAILLKIDQLRSALPKDVVFPKIQAVTGEVTVKNQITIPEIEMPEYPNEISVNNQIDYSAKLDAISVQIAKIKLDPKIDVQTQAPQVSIDLEEVKNGLQAIVEALSKPVNQPTSFIWEKTPGGNLKTFTEIYPNGKVVSEGWNIGRVVVNDTRK